MVLKVDKTTTDSELKNWIEKLQLSRKKKQKSKLAKYFGALPNIGDGLKIQKELRNEWD